MTLNEEILEVKYTPAFPILAEAARVTNSSKMRKTKQLEDKIIEPLKKTDFTDNSGY